MDFPYTPTMDQNPHTPVILSTALRVPSYAYREWGMPIGEHRKESDRGYAVEWEGGGPNQMDNVIKALKSAGMDNYSQILRDANTNFVNAYMKKHEGSVNYLEIGFGVSTVQMFEALDENDKDRIHIIGVEPSEDRANAAAEGLVKLGMKLGSNLKVHFGVNNNIIEKGYAEPGSQNLVTAVATFHHHSYLDTPMKVIYETLANGGIFVSSDWHNSMWEHPNRVYRFLESLPYWEGKEKDLADFVQMFPMAVEEAPELNRIDEAANADIRKFWMGWIKARAEAIEAGKFEEGDDIWMLEAHRPVERYKDIMEGAGLYLNSSIIKILYNDAGFVDNPHLHIRDNGILATIAGQKLV